MTDQHHQFHLARVQAELSAADRAASAMTRRLHLQLAALHADCAESFRIEDAPIMAFPVSRRWAEPYRTPSVRPAVNIVLHV